MISEGAIFGLAATLVFAFASVFLKHFSHTVGVLWTNTFKAVAAFFIFLIILFFTNELQIFKDNIFSMPGYLLLGSGLLGLTIGDLFMLSAFAKLGTARTLTLYQAQPIFMCVGGYLFFDELISTTQVIGIVLLISSVVLVTTERIDRNKVIEKSGIYFAFAFILLDGIGLLMTKQAMKASPEITSSISNFIRFLGAIVGFMIISRFKPIHLVRKFRALSSREMFISFFAAILGTVVSLWLWINAISSGKIAVIVALAGLSPIFAIIFENYILKTKATPRLFLAIFVSLIGIVFTVWNP